jgi:hypothetical protein
VRRLISILGALALLATTAPLGLDAAAAAFACCNGVMCPMHAAQAHSDCGMDMNGSGPMLKPCPVPAAPRYTAANLFVLPVPVVLNHTIVTERAIASLQRLMVDADSKIDPPPPRLQLAA